MGSPCNKTIIVYENRVTITHKIYYILWMSSEVSRTGNSVDKGMKETLWASLRVTLKFFW